MSSRLGLVRCEHCGRQFNPHSAARHIPWCEKQQTENKKHRLSLEKRKALERYKWRIGYRPSNQLASRQPKAEEQPSARARKSLGSLNSSATLSSLSASSTASIGTASQASANELGRQQDQLKGSRQGASCRSPKPRSQPPIGQLKRSISSLTLTKSRELNPGQSRGAAAAAAAVAPTRPARWLGQPEHSSSSRLPSKGTERREGLAKSTSDLSNVSELVESLVKRMEAIYAQNRLLLANVSARAAGCELSESESDEGNPLRCHHCKSSRMEAANYCHRCGCKLRPGSGGSSQGAASLRPLNVGPC